LINEVANKLLNRIIQTIHLFFISLPLPNTMRCWLISRKNTSCVNGVEINPNKKAVAANAATANIRQSKIE